MGSQRVGHDWATELNWARRPPNSRWILSFLLFSRPVFGPLVKFPGVAAKPCKVTKASRSRERDRPRRSKEEVARVIITPSWFHTALSDVLKHSHGWYHVLLVRWARKVLLAPLHREGSWAQDLHAGSLMGGWTPPQFSANLVGRWGWYLTGMSRTLQDRKTDHVLRQPCAQAGWMKTQIPNPAATHLSPTRGQGDVMDSMEKRAPTWHYWQMTPFRVYILDTLFLVTSDT